MNKKIGYIFSLFLILSFSLNASSLLYKIDSEKSTVYILGSIHLAKPELYPLAPEIIEAYEKSEVLAVELDPTSTESITAMQKSMARWGMYPDGKTLKSEIRPESYSLLTAYLNKAGIPIESVQKTRPWLLTIHLSIMEMTRLGYSAALGIDQYFLTKAKSEKKPIIELETAQEQMSMLTKEDKTFQDKLLRYTLQSMNELEPMLETMFLSWKKGDAASFDEIVSLPLQEDTDMKEVYEDIMIKRNYTMHERIKKFLKTDKRYFVIVGSGHVVGEEGIISLFRREGFNVTQY